MRFSAAYVALADEKQELHDAGILVTSGDEIAWRLLPEHWLDEKRRNASLAEALNSGASAQGTFDYFVEWGGNAYSILISQPVEVTAEDLDAVAIEILGRLQTKNAEQRQADDDARREIFERVAATISSGTFRTSYALRIVLADTNLPYTFEARANMVLAQLVHDLSQAVNGTTGCTDVMIGADVILQVAFRIDGDSRVLDLAGVATFGG
jgi:hypothetical protein